MTVFGFLPLPDAVVLLSMAPQRKEDVLNVPPTPYSMTKIFSIFNLLNLLKLAYDNQVLFSDRNVKTGCYHAREDTHPAVSSFYPSSFLWN